MSSNRISSQQLASHLNLIRGAMIVAFALLIASTALQAKSTDPRVKQMVNEFHRKNYSHVIRLATELYRGDPNPQFLANIARCYQLLGKPVLAMDYYQRHITATSRLSKRHVSPAIRSQIRAIRRRLATTHREVSVASKPTRAKVQIDGTAISRHTPFITWLRIGSHRLRFELPDHVPHTRVVVLSAGDLLFLQQQLQEFGSLSITTTPKSTIYLNGKVIGPGPISKLRLKPARYVLKILAAGFEPIRRQISIFEGRHTALSLQLPKISVLAKLGPKRRGLSQYRIAAYSTLGAAVLISAIGGALLAVAHQRKTDANAFIASKETLGLVGRAEINDYQQRFSTAKRFQHASFGLFAVGGGLLVSSIVLFFLKPKASEQVGLRVGRGRVSVWGRVRF